MRNLLRGFVGVWVLALWSFSPATAEQPQLEQQKIWSQIEAAPKRGLLYEVTTDNNIVYVFGTIHIGKPQFYPLDVTVTRAMQKSQFIAVEADILDQTVVAKQVAGLALYPSATSLDQHISPALMARVLSVLEKYQFPKEQAMRMKPWAVASTLTILEAARAGFDPGLGADAYVLGFAKGLKKPILELEGVARQLEIFNGLSEKEQQIFLTETVSDIENGTEQDHLRALVDAWSTSNVAALEREWKFMQQQARAASAGFFVDKLITDRNVAIAKRIDDYLRSGQPHFVAVGTFHLVGDKNIINLLRERGYRAREL